MSLDLLGEGFDLHGGGHGPELPAPRERAGPGGRPRQALRQPLDAPRLRRRRRGREDVEEPRQRRQPARPDRAATTAAPYRMLLLQSHYRSPVRDRRRQPRRGGQSALAGLDAFAARSAAVGAERPTPTPACSTRSGERWTTTSTRPAAMAVAVRHGAPGQRRARRRRPDGAARWWPRSREMPRAVGLELGARRRRAGRGVARRPPRSTRRGRPRTSPPPTPSAPSCRPTAGSSRRRSRARCSGSSRPQTRRRGAVAPSFELRTAGVSRRRSSTRVRPRSPSGPVWDTAARCWPPASPLHDAVNVATSPSVTDVGAPSTVRSPGASGTVHDDSV